MNLQAHPAAEAFPRMDKQRFEELKKSIAANGLRVPIVLNDGRILDGRNRAAACEALGITPDSEVYEGDPWQYVWDLNGERRDLASAEQRYAIWKYCNEQSDAWKAQQEQIQAEANRKRSEAAKAGRVGRASKYKSYICHCGEAFDREVWHCESCDHHWPDLERSECANCHADRLVLEQTVPLLNEHKTRIASAAASKTNAGAVQRIEALDRKRPDLVEQVRAGKLKYTEAARQLKKEEVIDKAKSLPEGKYRVIYADPPWQYGDQRDGNTTGATDHYPTMRLSEICALPVSEVAAEDAVLFLWVTSPLLESAFDVIRSWGFKYKTSFVWDKIKHNMGHYNSVRHEFLLICTKGSCTPDNPKLFDSVQSIERTEHSRKPEEFRTIIETLYPHGGKIELFRRGDTPKGWECWGNESA